jgi:hypothetical protein
MNMKNQLVALVGLLVAACGGTDYSAPRANVAPTISAIADQSAVANQKSGPIAFTVSDEQTGNLSVSASSDNQQIIPDSEIELGGSGSARTLAVTPVIDSLGDAYVTVFATDQQGLTASASFLLTIDPEQLSMQQFTRVNFAEDSSGEPELVNAVEFDQDASEDDFADLLAL